MINLTVLKCLAQFEELNHNSLSRLSYVRMSTISGHGLYFLGKSSPLEHTGCVPGAFVFTPKPLVFQIQSYKSPRDDTCQLIRLPPWVWFSIERLKTH